MPGRVTARRLNRAEYNNTVRDLLGVDLRPADEFPQDSPAYGFDNIGDALRLPPVLLSYVGAIMLWIVSEALGSLVPFLTLESNNLCIGSAWTLRANGVPNTSVNLLGTSSGKSWKISEWSKTDSSGTLSATGVFAAGTEGSHTLRVDIGSLLSNTISLVVSKCAP